MGTNLGKVMTYCEELGEWRFQKIWRDTPKMEEGELDFFHQKYFFWFKVKTKQIKKIKNK